MYLSVMIRYPYTAQDCPWAASEAKPYGGECAVKSALKYKDDFYKTGAGFS
jgi:hypothetical protein